MDGGIRYYTPTYGGCGLVLGIKTIIMCNRVQQYIPQLNNEDVVIEIHFGLFYQIIY